MTRTRQTHGERAVKLAESALQRKSKDTPDLITPRTLLALLVELGVPMYYVELDGEEDSGPWLSRRAAEDYIDTHICERGVCDDAYDRVRQEYDISNADGQPVE